MIEPENKIELKVQDITKIDSQSEQYILLLKEKRGERRIPLPLTAEESKNMYAVMNAEMIDSSPWARTFRNLTVSMDIIVEGVTLTTIKRGKYIAETNVVQNGQDFEFATPAIQAIQIALINRSPIFITQELLEMQYVRNSKPGSLTIAINTLSMEMLKQALETAIKEENYELAYYLSDEIKRRK